ncbi:putative glycosyltransferase EpsD [compost metagenome]
MYYNSRRYLDQFKFFIDKMAIKLTKPYLVGISEIVQKNNIKFFKNQSKTSRYIPNGVDLQIYNKENYRTKPSDFGLSQDDIVITYVARLSMGKNHITLLNAAKIVVEKYPLVKFLLAGDGENRNDVEEFILQNNLNQNVFLLGSINNIAELLSISTFCVFPSEFEGFSLTLIEKMAMGLPVIAADNDIFKSLIGHGENGLLFSMFDERDLAKNIFELIENKELRKKISVNSRSFSEQFSVKEMILKYESYYES